ncbi:MAG: tetratricopeptide repeat protein [Planctomycetota bacterium]
MAKLQRPAFLCIAGIVFATLVAGLIRLSWFSPPGPSVRRPTEISPEEYARGKEAFEARYARSADEADVFSWLGESFLSRDRFQKAVACFEAIPTSHPTYGRMARYLEGQSLLNLHRAPEAEQQLLEFITLEVATPQLDQKILIDARQRLRHIFEVELRFEDLHRLLQEIVTRGEDDAHETIVFCFPTLLRWNGPDAVKWLEQFHHTDPTNLHLNVALGRYRTGQGRLDEAIQILNEAVRKHPEDRAAKAALIEALRQADDPSMPRLVEQLPPQASDDPWLLLQVRGTFAIQQNRPEVAVTAFRQLIEQNQTSAEAWHGLGQAYRLLGDDTQRKQAQTMATALGRIQNYLGKAMQEPTDLDTFLKISEICLEADLFSEGMLMALCARRIAPADQRVLSAIQQLQTRSPKKQFPLSPR